MNTRSADALSHGYIAESWQCGLLARLSGACSRAKSEHELQYGHKRPYLCNAGCQ